MIAPPPTAKVNAMSSSTLSIGQCAALAALLECLAPKPGNVHRSADFEDTTIHDFAVSAVAIVPAMEVAAHVGVGRAVLEAIRATRSIVATNTNLGIVLLLAPLAAVPRKTSIFEGIATILSTLTEEDSRLVYEAIRLAKPGGLGTSREHDVAGDSPSRLLDAMQLAAERDQIAREYVTQYHLVLQVALPRLLELRATGASLTDSVIRLQVELLAREPDSLIARKCGLEMATQVSAYASQVLACGNIGDDSYYEAIAEFDFFLRSDGHKRNPGTTADLIAAAIFVGLRENLLQPPLD